MYSFDAIVLKDADHFLMMNRPKEFNQALKKAILMILNVSDTENSRRVDPSDIRPGDRLVPETQMCCRNAGRMHRVMDAGPYVVGHCYRAT
ncbi:MAG TPA: hypothetical protein ENN39_09305 [Desulfonatronum sp.]|nr:hypothetical protein [Desulfonatronum sp.]